jgi:NAD(P)H-hydrate epimerase
MSAARHLAGKGARIRVFLAGEHAHLKPSAATMYTILERMGMELHELNGDRDWDRFHMALKFSDGVVDGILGTGAVGELRKKTLKLIEEINLSEKPVMAIDIPSGVAADTGAVQTMAVKAAATLSLGLLKPGQLLSPGAEHVGRLVVDSIGLPHQLLDSDKLSLQTLDKDLAASLLPERPRNVHKGNLGHILIVAGSQGMTGAAIMAARAAMRTGAGLVTLAVPASQQPVVASQVQEIMTYPLPETEAGHLGGEDALQMVLTLANKADVLLMGPGLGRAVETMELVRQVSTRTPCRLVLDADALFAFARLPEVLAECKERPILTPHLGEMARLMGVETEILRGSLVPAVRKLAKGCKAVVAAKSECTLLAYPEGEVFFSRLGNQGMATAGAGDVLAGTIAGLVCQTEIDFMPLLGTYLHGRAGDLAYEELGEGLLAGDIIERLPKARQELLKWRQEKGIKDIERRLFSKGIDNVTFLA